MPSRHTIATVILVGGMAAVGADLWRRAPREVAVQVDYGAASKGLRRAQVVCREQPAGDVAVTAAFRYAASAAPESQLLRARLRPGAYRMDIHLEYDDRASDVVRPLRVEGEDVLRVDAAP